jgi:hypothetical protein
MAKHIVHKPRGDENPMTYVTVCLPGGTPLLALRDLAQALGCSVRRLPGGQLAIVPRQGMEVRA